MDRQQLNGFLAETGKSSFIEYLDPRQESGIAAFERRVRWAARVRDDPAHRAEATFILQHRDALRAVLVNEEEASEEFGDWAESVSPAATWRNRNSPEITSVPEVDDAPPVPEVFRKSSPPASAPPLPSPPRPAKRIAIHKAPSKPPSPAPAPAFLPTPAPALPSNTEVLVIERSGPERRTPASLAGRTSSSPTPPRRATSTPVPRPSSVPPIRPEPVPTDTGANLVWVEDIEIGERGNRPHNLDLGTPRPSMLPRAALTRGVTAEEQSEAYDAPSRRIRPWMLGAIGLLSSLAGGMVVVALTDDVPEAPPVVAPVEPVKPIVRAPEPTPAPFRELDENSHLTVEPPPVPSPGADPAPPSLAERASPQPSSAKTASTASAGPRGPTAAATKPPSSRNGFVALAPSAGDAVQADIIVPPADPDPPRPVPPRGLFVGKVGGTPLFLRIESVDGPTLHATAEFRQLDGFVRLDLHGSWDAETGAIRLADPTTNGRFTGSLIEGQMSGLADLGAGAEVEWSASRR